MYTVDVTPRTAGWEFSSLRVLDLPPGGWHDFDTGDSEWLVLPMSGSCTVALSGLTFRLFGRQNVFSGVTDFVYTPRDAHVALAAQGGGRFALVGARCDRRLPARYRPASAIPVEVDGRGQYSRLINRLTAAHGFECDRLSIVEVLTPGGNWCSFPPDPHGKDCLRGIRREEIYYFESLGDDGLAHQQDAASGNRRDTDFPAEVRDGDVLLVRDGWCEPAVSAPGHDSYYLNAMASLGVRRPAVV
ncbi:5-deoxy-glucuronate isomerase [Streptomyces sp. NPDC004270]